MEEIGYRLPDGEQLIPAYCGTCESRFDHGRLEGVRLFDGALTATQLAARNTAERQNSEGAGSDQEGEKGTGYFFMKDGR